MTAIPDDVVWEICNDTNEGAHRGWPWFEDRDGDLWYGTPYTHGGEQIMWPCPGDMAPMVRSEAEAMYGPLVPTTYTVEEQQP